MLKVVAFGATRGMGRALARLMAERGDRLFLLGRDENSLARSARDLAHSTGAGELGYATCDLDRRSSFEPALERADAALGGFDTVVVSAATFETQERLENDLSATERLLDADFTKTVVFCECVRLRLLARGGGTLCVFSSVAGDRARKPVVLYGAAKAGLSYYLEGLDHRYHHAGLRVVCVKPGFVKTGMTAALDPPPFAGEPDVVARTVLRAIDAARPVVYAPAAWRGIMTLIRWLPRSVMRRVEF
ncbi:MAG TPA: SDR family NAD(P)-dependent oxidoreductase [Candidatus Polarisedimenticolaceae bacterium]|nr:SDR family NAD(P)-dependent oxidoreductase [Candidatus Polarisedimenticolaceae bacterium]